MMNMKHFILMFVAVMFLANTVALSAWAKPCINIGMSSSSQHMANMDEMPCHENTNEDINKDTNNQQKPATQHCDGLCLCFHVSINQTPVLSDMVNIDMPHTQKDRLLDQVKRFASMATAPPSPPPKRNA